MAYQYLIMPDAEEGFSVKKEDMFYTNNEHDISSCVKEVSLRYPNATICVYALCELHKLKSKPEYQKYKITNGEVLPV